jgi:hypothetical protein
MMLESNAKITRIKMEGVFGAIFCPKDEKIMTPNAIGRKYCQVI